MSSSANTGVQSGWVTFGQFWLTFASMPHCWLVLARNLIPVAGVYVLGWPYDVGAFSIWFDGVVGLAAIDTVFVVLSAIGYKKYTNIGWLKLVASSLFFWVIGFGSCAIPYLMVAGAAMKHAAFNLPSIAVQIQHTPSLWISLTAIALGRFKGAFVGIRPESAQEQKADMALAGKGVIATPVQVDGSVLLTGFNLWARGFALLLIVQVDFGRVVIPLLAMALTYLEVLPPVLKAMPGPQQKNMNV